MYLSYGYNNLSESDHSIDHPPPPKALCFVREQGAMRVASDEREPRGATGRRIKRGKARFRLPALPCAQSHITRETSGNEVD